MGKIVDVLKTGKILVSDGAWGTFLYRKGMQAGECPDAWSVDRYDDVVDIAKSYIDAGSDMVESNSFGANWFKLEHFGKQDMVAEINEAAAKASREAKRRAELNARDALREAKEQEKVRHRREAYRERR